MEFCSAVGSEAYDAVVRAGRRLLVALDFDGTLSPIVDDPSVAHIHPDAGAAMDELAAEIRAIAVITGRPVSLEARSTSGVSLKIGVFIPKLPPVSPVMMRILLSGTLSTFASSVRVGCGRCMGV